MPDEREPTFESVLGAPEAEIDLAGAALLIAADEYPGLQVSEYLSRLDRLADGVRESLRGDEDAAQVILAMNRYLFVEQSFAANVDDYHDPRNSFLNEVIERRLGIPITLSVVYLEVGWRLGLALQGVSFPGHFLVKFADQSAQVVLDPFFKGRSLGESDLLERLAGMGGDASPPRSMLSRFLAPAGKREILARMLRNLKGIYLDAERFERALAVCEKMCLIDPQDPLSVRDRGYVYERLECVRPASRDYRRYLELAPDAPDAAEVRTRLPALERTAMRMH